MEMLGFFKKDLGSLGWWYCNPANNGEEVFQVGTFENKPIDYILKVLHATSFNAGCRWQREESKRQHTEFLESETKKLVRKFSKIL